MQQQQQQQNQETEINETNEADVFKNLYHTETGLIISRNGYCELKKLFIQNTTINYNFFNQIFI